MQIPFLDYRDTETVYPMETDRIICIHCKEPVFFLIVEVDNEKEYYLEKDAFHYAQWADALRIYQHVMPESDEKCMTLRYMTIDPQPEGNRSFYVN